MNKQPIYNVFKCDCYICNEKRELKRWSKSKKDAMYDITFIVLILVFILVMILALVFKW